MTGRKEPLEILHKPASGDNRAALTVVSEGSTSAGIAVKGAGTLLELRDAANTAMLSVSQAGAISGSAVSVASPTFTGTTTVAKLVPSVVALTDAATIATNAGLGNTFTVASVGGNRTLGAPTNPTNGQEGTWILTAVGAQRTITIAETAGAFALTGTVSSASVVIADGKTAVIKATYSSTATLWLLTGVAIQA